MNYAAIFELWHHRLGHPGTKITLKFVEHTIGVPSLKPNKFYNCAACMTCKFRNRHIARLPHEQPSICTSIPSNNIDDNTTKLTQDVSIGQHLHMDYSFVRGSDWSAKTNDGKLVTSIYKHRAYLLIIDKHSRYIWIYLTRDKSPPLAQVEGLLTHLETYKYATIMTDQGGELAKSTNFKRLCKKQDRKSVV